MSKTKQTHRLGGKKDSSQRRNMEARIIYFFCINIYAQVYWKYIISKGLLLGIRNSNQSCTSIQMYTGSNKDSHMYIDKGTTTSLTNSKYSAF